MKDVETYKDANLSHWDSVVEGHYHSDFYDVKGFMAGDNQLDQIELSEVGEVSHKSLLHIQCHFGLTTLSWARLGAKVTGVDFSPASVTTARELAKELRIDARFVESNVYGLSECIKERFDIVFTSYGVLCWLPDLTEWAREAAAMVKPGGRFHIVEFHPIMQALKRNGDGTVILGLPYFNEGVMAYEPDGTGSYATPDKPNFETTYEWAHSIGEVVTAISNSGLNIVHLNEFPFTTQGDFMGCLHEEEQGLWRYPDSKHGVPLTYAITAEKPR